MHRIVALGVAIVVAVAVGCSGPAAQAPEPSAASAPEPDAAPAATAVADTPLTPEVERLIEAVEAFDPTNARSVENALIAANAVRDKPNPRAVPLLVELASARVPRLSQGQIARRGAVRALGRYGDQPAAVRALIRVLETDSEGSPVRLKAAAANALAETGSREALQPLLMEMYQVSVIFQMVRGALTKLGKLAKPELLRVFLGKHEALNKFAADNGFSVDCDKGVGPQTECKAPGNLQFKAAILLGDMRAKEAVAPMLAELAKPGKVSFFDPRTGAPGPLNHNAILDALRKIGGSSDAPAVLAYIERKSTDDIVRPLAIDVYSMLTRDTTALPMLAKMIKDDGIDEHIRLAASLAYGRLVRDKSELRVLDFMMAKFERLASKYDRKAKKAKRKEDRAYHKSTADAYRAFARTFEQHKTRARVGILCRDDPKCYASMLDMSADDIAAKFKVGGNRVLTSAEKKSYQVAALDRALTEIKKLGPRARIVQAQLLEHVGSTDRMVRDGVHLALGTVAALPCAACVTRLDEVIKAQSDQTKLDRLVTESKFLLHYFQWAGR